MKLYRPLLAALLILTAGHASAWMSTFYDKNSGGSITHYDANTPEEARDAALRECRKKSENADCVELLRPVHGGAAVIALGTVITTDDNIFLERGSDPSKTADKVLSNCRQKARDCHHAVATWDSGATWSVLASNGTDGLYIALDGATREEAENTALEGCENKAAEKGNCKVIENKSGNVRAWYAVVGGSQSVGYAVSQKSRDTAKKTAMQECAKSSTDCKVIGEFKNTGPTPAPASFNKLEERIKKEKAQRASNTQPRQASPVPGPTANGDCRPKTNSLRCSSRCTNGNCIVSYENGCKIRVQVNPVMNPFNNQWEYPAPSC